MIHFDNLVFPSMDVDGREPDNEFERQRQLWQSVIVRAILDADGRCKDEGSGWQREVARADNWLRGDSEDFRNACHWAGLDPDFIRASYIAGRIDAKTLFSMEHGRRISKGYLRSKEKVAAE